MSDDVELESVTVWLEIRLFGLNDWLSTVQLESARISDCVARNKTIWFE